MEKRHGKIRDVARETGLSIATVSRVMNGATNVKEETRARVLDASSRLNYLPNPAARALSTSRSKTIAAIVPTLEYSIFAQYLTAIEQTLTDRGYSLVIALSNFDQTEELDAARKLLGMGAEAFILSGTEHDGSLIDLFERRSIPHLYTSVWNPSSTVPTIGYDNAALAGDAVNFLYTKGHRHIAVIHGPLFNSDRTRARKSGSLNAKQQNLELQFHETELSVAGGKSAMNAVLDAQPHCTAVLCFSDVLALGSYFAAQERGLKISEDLSIMGFDNLDWTAHISPSLTTVNLPVTTMGQRVATQLMDHLETDQSISGELIAGHIVERDSVRPINQY